MAAINRLEPKDTVLWLEDGAEFSGWSFGALARGFGEVVFNTAMSGYQEVLTDPSYWQQMVVMTYPHQGNYGINDTDSESSGAPKVSGFIVNELCAEPSNFQSQKSLADYLSENGIPGIEGVDTRALTTHLRQVGVLRGLILSKADRDQYQSVNQAFAGLPQYGGRDLIMEVTTKAPYWFSQEGQDVVVALDFGVKKSLLGYIADQGFKVVVLPANSSAEAVMSYKPKGVFLSNGPGDPALATYAVKTVRGLLGKAPIFGVCMGHQILAMALGGQTKKMKFGHRGINHPVLNQETGKVEVSSQNHGYVVDPKTLPGSAKVTHVNLNDGTCAGISCAEQKAFSVQYHPEASPGPRDSQYLFKQFADLVRQ
jgi:carbamoyl-phosphate synthase small subunit